MSISSPKDLVDNYLAFFFNLKNPRLPQLLHSGIKVFRIPTTEVNSD